MRTQTHYLDRARLGITPGIPMPGPVRSSLLRDQLKACAVGDSFVTSKSRKTCVYYFCKKLGIKANCRPEGNEEIRVWRVR